MNRNRYWIKLQSTEKEKESSHSETNNNEEKEDTKRFIQLVQHKECIVIESDLEEDRRTMFKAKIEIEETVFMDCDDD